MINHAGVPRIEGGYRHRIDRAHHPVPNEGVESSKLIITCPVAVYHARMLRIPSASCVVRIHPVSFDGCENGNVWDGSFGKKNAQ